MRVTLPRTVAAAAAGPSTAPRISNTLPTPYSWVNHAAPTSSSSTGPLAGKTIAIKDNISYVSSPTSCSSSILRDYSPPYTATCIQSLQDAGAHITGQTKMDEFGMGSQTTHLPAHYTPVHNPSSPLPDDPPRSAGGSSGGSAAAVAEGSCWAALGTDTGGSVRLPASYCGVVGLKPSYGMISRRGVIAYADSLDCVGVLGRSVDTVSQVFDTISHPDEGDMTCAPLSSRQTASSLLTQHLDNLPTYSTPSLKGLRIGIPLQTRLPEPHLQLPPALLDHLKSLGAEIHDVSLPAMRMALPAYYVLASAEASSNLGRYGGGWYGSPSEEMREGESGLERRKRIRSEGFGREVKKRILAGTYALSADEFNNTYLKALHLRHLLRQDYAKTFRIPHPLSTLSTASPSPSSSSSQNNDGIDLILHPTAIRTAPPLPSPPSAHDTNTNTAKSDKIGGRGASRVGKGHSNSEYLQDLLTVPASLAGLPALSVPSRPGRDGWPVGVSVTAQWGMEGMTFRLGRAIQRWNRGEV